MYCVRDTHKIVLSPLFTVVSTQIHLCGSLLFLKTVPMISCLGCTKGQNVTFSYIYIYIYIYMVSSCKRSNESLGSIKCASFSRTLLHAVSNTYIINNKLKLVTDMTKLKMLQRTPFGIFCTAVQSKYLPNLFVPKCQKSCATFLACLFCYCVLIFNV